MTTSEIANTASASQIPTTADPHDGPPPGELSPALHKPRFTRMTASIRLEPPPGYVASIILRCVVNNRQQRLYVFWLTAGRHLHQACSVDYKFSKHDIRCDVPDGKLPSPAKLEPHLQQFLGRKRSARRVAITTDIDAPPPTIKR